MFDDGRVRHARVHTSTGRFKRAAVKLTRMKIDSVNPELEVESTIELRTDKKRTRDWHSVDEAFIVSVV